MKTFKLILTCLVLALGMMTFTGASALALVSGDPTAVWNTFMGSISAHEEARAITVDASGNVYVAGISNDTWGSPVDAHAGGSDAFAAKFDSDGTRLWHTFMGSGSTDYGAAIAVDANGNVYVTGISMFQGWGSPIDSHEGGYQAFVVKLNGSGERQWNTFFGAGDGYGIAVDGEGNVYIAGESNWPWGSNPIEPYHGYKEAFVTKLDTNGYRQWHTFLGSGAKDAGMDIALDGSGNIYVGGYSEDTWGSPLNPYAGGGDAFAAKLNTDGTLAWNTFMGAPDGTEWSYGVSVDESGNVYVAGDSTATWGDSPVTSHAGGADGFVAKLNSSGGRQWNTFLGSATEDHAYELALDGNGNLYTAGFSDATWGEPTTAYAGGRDAFAVKLDNSGGRIWNTFLGSSDDDLGNDVGIDAGGSAYIAGLSNASWGSPINPFAGSYDGFIAKLASETPTPQAQISELISLIQALPQLNRGQKNSLIVKLNAASHSLDQGNSNAACGQLGAFINQARALVQSGRLDAANGSDLIARAQAIESLVGCP